MSGRIFKRVQMLNEVADQAGLTMSQLALAWILQKDGITSCITGASKPEQIRENSLASGVELDAAQLARIEEIIGPAVYSHPMH